MGTHSPTKKNPSIIADMTRGALQGDFAPELGLPGAATQVALTFVPVVGTLCGLRDAAALNLLAMVPVVGGVAKVVELGRHARRLKKGWVVSQQRRAG
jgi:hypothetical protein